MKRSAIRGGGTKTDPDYASLHPGYVQKSALAKKSAPRPDSAPLAALFAPCQRINDAPAGHWNQRPDSGHIGCRGTESREHARCNGLEAKGKMRSFLIAVTGLMLFATGAAQAKVAITVDKDNQQMTVAVDGVERYRWPVSSGLPSYETPNGSFRTFRMEEDHYSKEFDDAPMPHSIFFTKIGHAIHGTDSVNRLGSPASHGCVRLSRDNASTLYALVEQEGVLNTTVTLTGSSQVALARNPRPRATMPSPAAPRRSNTKHAIRRRRRRSRRDHAAAPRAAPQARAPMTAISIRPTAVPTRRAIRRRAAAASTMRRPIRSRSSNITTTAAMPRRRRATTTSSGRTYQPRGLFTYQD